ENWHDLFSCPGCNHPCGRGRIHPAAATDERRGLGLPIPLSWLHSEVTLRSSPRRPTNPVPPLPADLYPPRNSARALPPNDLLRSCSPETSIIIGLSWQDDFPPGALHNGEEFRTFGLRHAEAVECLREVVKKRLPFLFRDVQVGMGILHGAPGVSLRPA